MVLLEHSIQCGRFSRFWLLNSKSTQKYISTLLCPLFFGHTHYFLAVFLLFFSKFEWFFCHEIFPFFPFFSRLFGIFTIFINFIIYIFLLYSTYFDHLMPVFTYLTLDHIFKKLFFHTMMWTPTDNNIAIIANCLALFWTLNSVLRNRVPLLSH